MLDSLPDNPFVPLSVDELNDLRMKIVNHGYDPTPEEMKAVVQTMQMERATLAQNGKGKSKKKASPKTPPPSLDDLLG